jgi:hypothetical protein
MRNCSRAEQNKSGTQEDVGINRFILNFYFYFRLIASQYSVARVKEENDNKLNDVGMWTFK